MTYTWLLVTAKARRAIALIRACVEADRFALTVHFCRRMEERGLYWPDVMAIIDSPDDVVSGGKDEYGRPKSLVSGQVSFSGKAEIVCAIELTEDGTEFITLYWED